MTGLALGAARTCDYAAISIVVGGIAFRAWCWAPAIRADASRQPGSDAQAAFDRRLARLIGGAVSLGLAASATVALVGGDPGASLPALARGPLLSAEAALGFVHLLAASLWVGGVACLAIAVPGALARLGEIKRIELLLDSMERFSPLALASVGAIVSTGVAHACLGLRRPGDLLATGFGLLILAKLALLAPLLGLGAVNRSRVIPALRLRARHRRGSSEIAALARRSLGCELALMVLVLAASAALVSEAPR